MRRRLAVTLLILSIASVVSGQDSGLPLCHADQINWAEDASPQIEALGQQLATVQTTDDFLSYSRAQLTFREDVWGAPPLCDPYLEAGALISRYYNDIVSLGVIEWLDVLREDSPRLQQLEQAGWDVGGLLVELIGDYLSLLVSPDPRAEQSDGTLPACTIQQLQGMRAAKTDEYTTILNAAFAVDTIDDLLRYDADQLAFREKIWKDLPPCAEAFAVAPLMFHISGDFLTAHALAFAGVPFDSNPFYWQLERDIRRLPSWLFEVMETTPDLTRQLFESNLPSCSPAQLAQIAAIEPPFDADKGHVLDLMDTESLGTAREYALTEIRWRQQRMPLFPPCTESIELAFAMSNLGNDLVAGTALHLAGARPWANPYRGQTLIGAGEVKALRSDLPAISELASVDQPVVELPGCTLMQVDSVAQSMLNSFQDVLEVMSPVESVESPDDYINFADSHFSWRESILERLPPCAEAIEIALFLSQITGIFAPMNILEYAGLSPDENPYIEEITNVAPVFQAMMTRIEETLSRL